MSELTRRRDASLGLADNWRRSDNGWAATPFLLSFNRSNAKYNAGVSAASFLNAACRRMDTLQESEPPWPSARGISMTAFFRWRPTSLLWHFRPLSRTSVAKRIDSSCEQTRAASFSIDGYNPPFRKHITRFGNGIDYTTLGRTVYTCYSAVELSTLAAPDFG
jgi:hypothetical protein